MSGDEAARCIACTSEAVARVLDGASRKPVCATHRRLYAERGYLIDALPPPTAPNHTTTTRSRPDGAASSASGRTR